MRRRFLIVLTTAALFAGVAGCDAAAFNRWLVERGKPALTEPELSKVVALITAAENENTR